MTTFYGWIREPHAAWKAVCRASTWGGCWRLLIDVRSGAPTCEKIVRTTHPEHRRRPR